MRNIVIEKYKELLSFFEESTKNTTSENIKKDLKKSYLNFANELIKFTGEDINIYKEKIEVNNLVKEEPIDLERYIYLNVYKNSNIEIGNKLQQLVLELQGIMKEKDENKINEWINKYTLFANEYKDQVDREKILEYMKVLLKKYDQKKDNNEIKEETLKIKNVKKINMSDINKKGLNLFALINNKVGRIPNKIQGYLINKLNKKGFINSKLNSILNKNGYSINENKELVDQEGKVINYKEVEKEKAGYLKQKLMNLGTHKDNGLLKKSFKKNRLTTMLLNMKITQSIKDKFKKEEKVEKTNNDNDDMYKGLVKC